MSERPTTSSVWCFDGHPGLEPLILYEGFKGYPGRKEHPFHDYEEY